jgi:hypothetical protein
MMVTNHHLSAEHIRRYLDEIDHRCKNERQVLGVNDMARIAKSIHWIVG